jgi:hypothetical protein
VFDFGASLSASRAAPAAPVGLVGPSGCYPGSEPRGVFLVFRLWPWGALESGVNIGHFQIELGSALISDPLYILTIFLHFYNGIGYGLSFYQQKNLVSRHAQKSVSGFMNPTICNLKMANVDFALRCPLWPRSKGQKDVFRFGPWVAF